MATERRRRLLHLFFDISVIAKGIDGVLEIVGGVALFFVPPDRLYALARILTQHELSEDPHDAVAQYILHAARHLSVGAKTFAAFYLLWHGLVKAGLVTGLLLRWRWAYPVAIGAFSLFLVYQIYRYVLGHAPGMLVLSVLDAVVIALTWFEYRRLRESEGFV